MQPFLASETDESETVPRVALCTSLFWGLLKRVGRERMADGLWVARKSNMSVLLNCNEASSRSL